MKRRLVPLRMRVLMHVLRGRPTVYRMHFVCPIETSADTRHVLIADSTIHIPAVAE